MTTKQNGADRIAATTVVLELTISHPSFSAAIPSDSIMDEADRADRAQFYASKKLINRSALKDLNRHRGEFLAWLRAREVPCGHVLGSRLHLVPLSRVEEIDTRVRSFRVEREVMVNALMENYATLIEEARLRLAGHFRQDDYPTAEVLRDAFGVRARFLSLNVPAALEQVNKDLFERERARVQSEWAEAAGEVRGALREGFAQLVAKLADRLAPDEEGKPKTFQASTVTNLTEFLSMFQDRDITRDTELQALVKQAQALLAGADPKVLRQQETTRDRVLAGFGQITEKLTALGVTIAPTRRLATADEEV